MVGSLGDVVFEVSSEVVRTFKDFQMQHGANYIEHSIINRKGLLEFTGLKASSANFSVHLDAGLGVNPVKELEQLHNILKNHEAVPLIFDNEIQGDGLWVLESLDENFEVMDNHGTPIIIETSLKLREYIEI